MKSIQPVVTGTQKKDREKEMEEEMERQSTKANRRHQSTLHTVGSVLFHRHVVSKVTAAEERWVLHTGSSLPQPGAMHTAVHWLQRFSRFQPHCKESWEKQRSTWTFGEHCLFRSLGAIYPSS